ncbi:phosphotransferase system glucose/maltose/N-acetylglucosamine-specific IIC component [Paenibacillus sp. SORGH_AS306]|nr:phosphotransferase system glucose/maltose/N-acetylglucosamine-specific IIC component [Paenibacillus sp. SORGH_AS_0306]
MKTFFEKAQRFGKSFMLPIAVLPAAGLLLGIGGALSNPNTVSTYPVLQISWLQYIFKVMSSAGDITFSNLALIFAIGVAVGLARSDKGTAGLAAALAYLVMNASINAMLINSNQLVTEIYGGSRSRYDSRDTVVTDRCARRYYYRFGDSGSS